MLFLDLLPDLSTQIFFLICVLGLFHGLLVLPVLLALVGPPSRHPVVPTNPQSFGKAKSSLHRKNDDEGDDRDIDGARQQDRQNVAPDATSDANDEITPLRDGEGEEEKGKGEEEDGLMQDRRGSSIS